jgi:hypothetical protein
VRVQFPLSDRNFVSVLALIGSNLEITARKGEEEDLEAIAAKEQKVFRYDTLVAATRNFSMKNKLGEGGFGPVFRVIKLNHQ